MDIRFFNGELYEFLISQDDVLVARINKGIELLEKYGQNLRFPHSKKVGEGVFELRILGHRSLRILFGFEHGGAVILQAFFKKSQRIPNREIRLAEKRLHSSRE